MNQNAVMNHSFNPQNMGSAWEAPCPTGSNFTTAGTDLQKIGNRAYYDTQKQTPVTALDLKCCPNPPMCKEEVAWRAAYKGCPYTYVRDQPTAQCEVAPLGDRYWVGDLNPLLYERRIMQAADQNPYNFMQARQMLTQFLMKDVVEVKDRYTRQISDLDKSYCMQLNTQGPPTYTTF